MVDLQSQYLGIKDEVDLSVNEVISTGNFIGGSTVERFSANLAEYLGVKHIIPCANGTDALQIALMSLGLEKGDEIIVPSFTYVATAEVIALLGLKPVLVDVDPFSFNITYDIIEPYITDKTKAIIPVHLFGQSSDMEEIISKTKDQGIYIIEDNAQSIGAEYIFKNGNHKKTGNVGDIGCLSFYPSKNLGAYGDGGAIMTNNDKLACRLKSITNHGQSKKYYHDIVGCNSRLDAIQAAVLDVKLQKIDEYNRKRNDVATNYDNGLSELEDVIIPHRTKFSTHVFHQYTLQIKKGNRDKLKSYLMENHIPSMIYYPLPLYKQKAYQHFVNDSFELPVTEKLCASVLSLPMCPELQLFDQNYIIDTIHKFYKRHV